MMKSRFWDRITNSLKGKGALHWCSVHKRHFNSELFKECPDCLIQSGPYYRGKEHEASAPESCNAPKKPQLEVAPTEEPPSPRKVIPLSEIKHRKRR